MKCCPLWSDLEQQSQIITSPLPPSPRAPISVWTHGLWEVVQRQTISVNLGAGLYCGKEDDIRNPKLPEETALETLNFNKITNSGRGGRRRQNSMCHLELAARNTDLWTPLNHISFSLLGPAALTQCGKRLDKNKLKKISSRKTTNSLGIYFHIR